MTHPGGKTYNSIRLVGKNLDGSDWKYAVVDNGGRFAAVGYHWNSSTLAYEVNTGGATGAEVNVTNFPATQLVSIASIEDNKAQIVYEDGDDLYICKAPIGTALGSAAWQIKRVNTADPITTTWCDGNANFDNTATDLETVRGHTYS